MAKKKQKDLQNELKESAHQIWLAGLGALAAAEEEGSKLFKSLVKKGEGFEKRSKKQIDQVSQQVSQKVEEKVDGARDQAGDAWHKLNRSFDERVAGTLQRLGVPSRMEIQKLTKRVEQLTRKVDELKPKKTTRKRTSKRAKSA